MKTRLTIFVICLFGFKQILFAQIIQDFKFAKQINAMDAGYNYPYLKVEKNQVIQFIPYYSAIVYDTLNKVADNSYPHLFIAVVDTMGNLKSSVDCKGFHFTQGGTPTPTFVNDTTFYFSNPLNTGLNIAGVKIYDPIAANGYHIAQCDLSGSVKDVQAFYVTASLNTMHVHASDKSLYILLGNVTAFDSTKHDTSLFRIGKTSIVKIDSNGNIAHTWFVDGAFGNGSRFNIAQNNIFLYNVISNTNYSYTLDTLTYNRYDSIDRFTFDIIIGSIKLSAEKYNWYDRIKVSTMHGASFAAYGDDSLLLLGIQFTDTITFGGQHIVGGTTNNGANFVFASLDANGKIIWKKKASGLIVSPDDAISVTQSRNLSIKFISYLSVLNYDGSSFKVRNISNRIITDKNGNLKIFHNAAFDKDGLSQIYDSDNDSVYYANAHLISGKPIVINGQTFTAPDAYSLGFAFYKAQVVSDSTFVTSGLAQINKNDILIKVFPNPVSNSFYLESSLQTTTNAEIKIYDVSGKIIFTKHQNISDEIDVSGLDGGMYFIIVKQDDKTFYSKFIKY